jgi:hypothetical protein
MDPINKKTKKFLECRNISACQALNLMTTCLGVMITGGLNSLLSFWIADNLNDGKLENLFFLLAILMGINFCGFVLTARGFQWVIWSFSPIFQNTQTCERLIHLINAKTFAAGIPPTLECRQWRNILQFLQWLLSQSTLQTACLKFMLETPVIELGAVIGKMMCLDSLLIPVDMWIGLRCLWNEPTFLFYFLLWVLLLRRTACEFERMKKKREKKWYNKKSNNNLRHFRTRTRSAQVWCMDSDCRFGCWTCARGRLNWSSCLSIVLLLGKCKLIFWYWWVLRIVILLSRGRRARVWLNRWPRSWYQLLCWGRHSLSREKCGIDTISTIRSELNKLTSVKILRQFIWGVRWRRGRRRCGARRRILHYRWRMNSNFSHLSMRWNRRNRTWWSWGRHNWRCSCRPNIIIICGWSVGMIACVTSKMHRVVDCLRSWYLLLHNTAINWWEWWTHSVWRGWSSNVNADFLLSLGLRSNCRWSKRVLGLRRPCGGVIQFTVVTRICPTMTIPEKWH